jgi:hypothetical protein
MPIQFDSGSDITQPHTIKSNAIQLAAPGAVSYAIKDAAEHLGKMFGRDLGRKHTIEFSNMYYTAKDEPKISGSDNPSIVIPEITTQF